MTENKSGSRWMIGAVVLAAVCCAGPALFAAVAAGSLGAVLGASLGVVALAIPAAAVLVVVVVLIHRSRGAGAPAPHDDATCEGRRN